MQSESSGEGREAPASSLQPVFTFTKSRHRAGTGTRVVARQTHLYEGCRQMAIRYSTSNQSSNLLTMPVLGGDAVKEGGVTRTVYG